jgi:hypothetical protein
MLSHTLSIVNGNIPWKPVIRCRFHCWQAGNTSGVAFWWLSLRDCCWCRCCRCYWLYIRWHVKQEVRWTESWKFEQLSLGRTLKTDTGKSWWPLRGTCRCGYQQIRCQWGEECIPFTFCWRNSCDSGYRNKFSSRLWRCKLVRFHVELEGPFVRCIIYKTLVSSAADRNATLSHTSLSAHQ